MPLLQLVSIDLEIKVFAVQAESGQAEVDEMFWQTAVRLLVHSASQSAACSENHTFADSFIYCSMWQGEHWI